MNRQTDFIRPANVGLTLAKLMVAANVVTPKNISDAYSKVVATYDKLMRDLEKFSRSRVKALAISGRADSAGQPDVLPCSREQLEEQFFEKRRSLKEVRFKAIRDFGELAHPFFRELSDKLGAHIAVLEAGERKDFEDFGLEPTRSDFIRGLSGAIQCLEELFEKTAFPESVAGTNPRQLCPWIEAEKAA